LIDFNDETENVGDLPSWQVHYSGSFYIGNYYSDLTTIFVSAGNGYTYYSDPYNNRGFYTYDEYEFIP
jgi:hypothetical protein